MKFVDKLGWSAINSLITSLLVILQLAVTTKYLDVSDFAIFALVTIFMGFCLQFVEGGFGNAIVTFTDLSPDEVKQVISLAGIVAFLFSLALIILSIPISFIYEEPELIKLLVVSSFSIPLFSLARCFKSLVQIKLNMKKIALIDISSRFFSFIVTLILSMSGFGVWSLVMGTLSLALLQFIFYRLTYKSNFFNRVDLKNEKIRKVITFSLLQSGDLFLNYFTRNLDVLLLVKIVGQDVSGAYSIVKTFLMQISDTIFISLNRFFYPHLSLNISNLSLLRLEYWKFHLIFIISNFIFISAFYFFNDFVSDLIFKSEFLDFLPLALMCTWLLLRYSTATVSTLWLVMAKPHIGIFWSFINMLSTLFVFLVFDSNVESIVFGFICISGMLMFVSYLLALYLLKYDLKLSK